MVQVVLYIFQYSPLTLRCNSMREFRLPTRCKWDLRSSEMVRRV